MALTRKVAIAAALAIVAVVPRLAAHDVPADVRLHAFVKPEGSRLRLLARVPLEAMRDIDFPRREGGFIDVARAEPALRDAATLWIANSVLIYEGDERLGTPQVAAARVSLPSDRSFVSYDEALAHVTGPPLPDDTRIHWEQGMLDVLLDYRIASSASRFSVHPALESLGLKVTTSLRFVSPTGSVRAFELHGDPGVVRLDPRWHQAVLHFGARGFRHILDGADHLLFLVCLVIPLRRLRQLVIVVTAFTIAHSVTLVASAYDLAPSALWFPPLVETLIAASIVYMALENIVTNAGTRWRWAIAFGFGLIHGFGFSFALKETLQFAGSHLLTSLLAFNAGVEAGQVLVLLVLVPAIQALFRHVVAERIGIVILSALVAHTGWHWMTDRWGQLRQYAWPALDAALVATALRVIMAVVIVAGLIWLAARVRGRAAPAPPPTSSA